MYFHKEKEQKSDFNFRTQEVSDFTLSLFISAACKIQLQSTAETVILQGKKNCSRIFLKGKLLQSTNFTHSMITSQDDCCEDLIADKSDFILSMSSLSLRKNESNLSQETSAFVKCNKRNSGQKLALFGTLFVCVHY